MVRDDHTPVRFGPGRSAGFRLAAVALALLCVTLGGALFLAPWPKPTPNDDTAPPPEASQAGFGERLFRNWPKPDVALLLTAQQHGYLQPCGCSEPQLGGLARRYNLLRALAQDRGWPIVAADLGDIAQKGGPQAMLKYVYSMRALKLMNYVAVGVGENELSLPLLDALGEYALNEPAPAVTVANLQDRAQFPGLGAAVQFGGGQGGAPRVGFTCVVGPTVAQTAQNNPTIRFDPPEKVLPDVVRQLQAKADLLVLLYQGSIDEAKACAARFPAFHVVLCLSEAEAASSRPEKVGDAMVIAVGHKGRSVGIVGVNRTGQETKPFELRYEQVSLEPEFETPDGQDAKNPIHALLQEYATEVKDKNYLAKFPTSGKHPVQVAFPQAKYVGSEKCKKCHEDAYKVWAGTPHAHAYETLATKPKRPTLRQYDGECVVCHVTGFGNQTGFTDEARTPHLKNVGCEACHGPGSEHIKDKLNDELQKLMDPWKAPEKASDALKTRLKNLVDQSCQKCHDGDNDVNWDFSKKWPKIDHPSPK